MSPASTHDAVPVEVRELVAMAAGSLPRMPGISAKEFETTAEWVNANLKAVRWLEENHRAIRAVLTCPSPIAADAPAKNEFQVFNSPAKNAALRAYDAAMTRDVNDRLSALSDAVDAALATPSPKPEEPVREDATPDPVEMAELERERLRAGCEDALEHLKNYSNVPGSRRAAMQMARNTLREALSTTNTARGSSGQGQGKGETE
jgi:hypothetical protein